jgi:hypothetical protein
MLTMWLVIDIKATDFEVVGVYKLQDEAIQAVMGYIDPTHLRDKLVWSEAGQHSVEVHEIHIPTEEKNIENKKREKQQ